MLAHLGEDIVEAAGVGELPAALGEPTVQRRQPRTLPGAITQQSPQCLPDGLPGEHSFGELVDEIPRPQRVGEGIGPAGEPSVARPCPVTTRPARCGR